MPAIGGATLRAWRRSRGWDVPEMARQLRRAARDTGQAIAAHEGLVRMIRDWERGAHQLTERYQLLYWALGFSTGQSTPPEAAPSSHPLDTGTQPWELADTLTRSSISMTAVSFMEESVTSLAIRYPFTPPAELIPDVQSMLRTVNDALSRSQPVNVRARCVRLTGILCGVVGQLADDTGRPDQSAAWFSAAAVAADEAGDTDLAAWALALRSIGCHFRGEYALSAELLDRARATVAASSTARRRAWLTALSARAQAAVAARRGAVPGDSGDVMRLVDDARGRLETAEQASDTDFFDTPRLAGMAGTALLLLRDTQAAQEHLTDALAARNPADTKGRALLTLDLAECHAIDREPEHAAALAATALDMASEGIVRPVVTRAAAVRRALRQWATAPGVRELGEQLGEITQGEG